MEHSGCFKLGRFPAVLPKSLRKLRPMCCGRDHDRRLTGRESRLEEDRHCVGEL
jgi:hypothetical protein